MEIITSKTNSKIKRIIKLKSQKEKDESQLFLTSDLNIIKRAHELGLIDSIYSTHELKFMDNYLVSKDVMEKIADEDVIAILKYLPRNNKLSEKVIYLDRISDPTNLGKIILLAIQYGYKDIILSNNSTSIYNPKCLEIIKDNLFNINFFLGDINTLKHLKQDDYQIISTGLKSSILLNECKAKNKRIIVFGNEANGVSSDILSLSDIVIRIPIKNIDSLNVSVAAAITLDNLA